MAQMDDEEEAEITDRWPTKAEVAEQIGKSLAAVTRLQKAGRLTPRVDESGNNRYDPKEVAKVLADPLMRGGSTRGEEFAEYQLDTVRALIGLVKDPREKIDELQFRIIERQDKIIEKLTDQLEKQRAEVDAARDNTADRTAALNIMNSETRVKELAGMRMVETLSRLMSGGNNSGVQLTPEQLQELVLVEDFLTVEQVKAAKAAIVASNAKKNGDTPPTKDSLPLDKVMKAVAEGVSSEPK
jgi:hypothetical protein